MKIDEKASMDVNHFLQQVVTDAAAETSDTVLEET